MPAGDAYSERHAMTDNVVSLSLIRPQPPALEMDECVDALRARVDSGEAVGIAYVVVNKDGSVATNFVHGPVLMALLGGVHHLASRIERAIDTP